MNDFTEITESYEGSSGKMLPGLNIEIKEALQRLETLFKRKRVVLAYLFGSYARDEARTSSDIDIAVLLDCENGQLYLSFKDLMLSIYETLGTERIDLLLLNDSSLSMRFEIISQGKIIYFRDDEELNAFEMNTIRKFQDTAYLRIVQNDYLKKRAIEWYSKKKVC